MTICVGATVKSPTNLQGKVISIDNSLKTVLIQKENGGIFACPINSVTVISYREVE